MRVFVTGATGFIGSAVVGELIAAGHQVLGMTRSEAGAKALAAAGAQAHHGSLEDPASLTRGAAQADGVIHLAFNHDFSTYMANCEDDRIAIAALAEPLKGSDRPLLITSGTGLVAKPPGQPATEDDPSLGADATPRAATEEAANLAQSQGVNVSIVRLPQVHDTRRQGLVTYTIARARETGRCAYIGEGANRWPAAHVSDTARLYRLALEKGESGARYHAVAEPGVSMRAIAETLGKGLGLPAVSITPEEAPTYFGWLAMFATLDQVASSQLTQQRLGWHPTGPTLLADLEQLQLDEA